MSTEPPARPRTEARHQQVARNLRNQIEAGELRDGEVLPTTRELAQEWGVSSFTISEALKTLEAEGLVMIKPRSGTVVTYPDGPTRDRSRPTTPHVVMVGGYAGSGKTELGRILARRSGWAMLDKDTITRPVVETALELLGRTPDDRDSREYVELVRPREYEALITAGIENVECGNSVILTAPFVTEFGDEAWMRRIASKFESLGALTHVVWISCDADTMQMYIRHRGAARDAAKLADWPAWVARIDVEFRPVVPHHVIENSADSSPLQEQAAKLLAQVVSAERA